ncbi:MAG: GDSL-type esterase/lipase family protein, partial [Saprospiraceae bacterium]
MKFFLILSIIINVVCFASGFFIIQKLGGLNYLLFRMKNNGISGNYENRKHLFTMLPTPTTKERIVMLGDSMTEAGEWVELLPNNKVFNRGIAGDVCENLILRIKDVTKLQPNKIFLMIGINNLLFDVPSNIAREYEKLVNELTNRCPDATIYIQSVLPVNNKVRNLIQENKEIVQLNKFIIKIAERHQIEYIDLHSKFK